MPLRIMVPTVKKNWSWTLPAAVSFSMTSMVAFCKILLVVFVEIKLERVAIAMPFDVNSLRKQLSLWSVFYLKPKAMILIEVSSSDCFYLTTSSHWSGLGSVQFPPLNQYFLVFPLDWNIFPVSISIKSNLKAIKYLIYFLLLSLVNHPLQQKKFNHESIRRNNF